MLTALLALGPLLSTAALHQTKALPPRLVVVIAVDQLVPEQLQRLDAHWTGGFRRFLDQGAVFWRATVDYACTETGPGHATLATGRYPARHGIVGNGFVLRDEGRFVYCVGDPAVQGITGAGPSGEGGASPALLVGDALGDLLEARVPGSKTVAVAGKDRSAVLLGGRAPDVALWWGGGGFATSSHYAAKLPEFAGVWNAAWRERARGWKWTAEIPGAAAQLGTAPDLRAGESRHGGGVLPRTLPDDDAALDRAVVYTPLFDFFTLELATLALDALELGRDDAVDYLGLGLSSCDILGHGYGPDSVEVTDLLLRDDRDLGRFFTLLDEKIGAGRWLACLSSDHGVLDLPETLAERGVGARRVTTPEVQAMQALVREALTGSHPELGELELRFADLGFSFDEAAVRAAGLEPAELRALLAAAALESDWVADAYTLEELTSEAPRDPWVALYRNCQFPGRGPDVTLRPEPWLLIETPEGTSHGSPYPYDRRVPLAFLGGAVKPQQRFDAASPVDAVPTLLRLLGLDVPEGLDGKVLKVD
jgi:hypothetical protein